MYVHIPNVYMYTYTIHMCACMCTHTNKHCYAVYVSTNRRVQVWHARILFGGYSHHSAGWGKFCVRIIKLSTRSHQVHINYVCMYVCMYVLCYACEEVVEPVVFVCAFCVHHHCQHHHDKSMQTLRHSELCTR